VALVAVLDDAGGTIVGGGRYVLVRPGTAEVAFAVVDEFQWQGVGGALMRHIATIARAAGLEELIAEVLAQNRAMLKVFEKSGLPCRTTRESGVAHVTSFALVTGDLVEAARYAAATAIPACSQVLAMSLTVARCTSRFQRRSSNSVPRCMVQRLSQMTRSCIRQRCV
jgi:GNAT superfamily N-acetyltransferase